MRPVLERRFREGGTTAGRVKALKGRKPQESIGDTNW
jgi:hypothetical protein